MGLEDEILKINPDQTLITGNSTMERIVGMKRKFNSAPKVIVCIVALLCFGCTRGETKTLSDVYSLSKTRYESAFSMSIEKDTVAKLKSVTAVLDKLALASSNYEADAKEVAGLLTSLGGNVAYTVRPALFELIAQYRTIGSGKGSANPAALRLLAARTYALLASELETTRFRVS